jgi:hypothetical protein
MNGNTVNTRHRHLRGCGCAHGGTGGQETTGRVTEAAIAPTATHASASGLDSRNGLQTPSIPRHGRKQVWSPIFATDKR